MRYYLLLIISCYVWQVQGQVGIGTDTPHASSILDIQATDRGLLIPRVQLLSTNNTSPVASPATGLLVYNTNTVGDVAPGFYYWTESAWKAVISTTGGGGSGDGWGLSGNTASGTDFLGTTNYEALRFKINNNDFGQFYPGGGISIGGSSSANTDNAIAIGTSATAGNSLSVALGNNAQASSHQAFAIGNGAASSSNNTMALGNGASASGQNSTAIGYGAQVTSANTIRLGNNDAKVGIGTSELGYSTIFEVNSSDKGILIPRIALSSTSSSSPVSNPEVSTLIYNTQTVSDVTPGFYYWTGSVWKPVGGDRKAYGEIYFSEDKQLSLNQYNNTAGPSGVVNALNSGITVAADGFTSTTGGTFKVTCTITYSKNSISTADEVEFFLTEWGGAISGTSVRGALSDARNTVTISKIMSLTGHEKYYFGIGRPSANVDIIIHKDMTTFIVEQLD